MMGMGWFWLLLLLLAAFFLLPNANRPPSQGQGGLDETPVDILKKRYARGEITPEQFEEMKKHLQ